MAYLGSLNPPKKVQVSVEGNNQAMWLQSKEDFNFFMPSAGFKDKSDDQKVALVINLGGEELKNIYKSLTFAPKTAEKDESLEYETVLTKLDTYFNVKKNQLSARKTFSILNQKKTESLDQFITRIKTGAQNCDFSVAEKDFQMRDRLVFGCMDDNLREKFFRDKYETLTFERSVLICGIYQSARRQLAACRDTEETVHAVTTTGRAWRGRQGGNAGRGSRRGGTTSGSRGGGSRGNYSGGTGRFRGHGAYGGYSPAARGNGGRDYKECDYCALKHQWGTDKCPAYGKTCAKCGRKNHYTMQ